MWIKTIILLLNWGTGVPFQNELVKGAKEMGYLKKSCVLILLLASLTFATDITFSSSGSIGVGDSYDDVYLENDGTVVDMTGGQITKDIYTNHNICTFNFSGGNISGSGADINIRALGYFNMSGGVADLHGFYLDASGLNYDIGGVGHISGGVLSSDNVKIYPDAHLTLDNANVTFGMFDVMTDATVDIYGGNLNITSAYIAYGYFIGEDYIDAGSTINIYGYGFDYDVTNQILSGYLQDNNYFQIGEVNEFEYTSFNLIPEPATLLLFGLGGLLLRKQK